MLPSIEAVASGTAQGPNLREQDVMSYRPRQSNHEGRCKRLQTCTNASTIQFIRPLGVRPLTYPERVQKPWGFLVAEAGVAS